MGTKQNQKWMESEQKKENPTYNHPTSKYKTACKMNSKQTKSGQGLNATSFW